VDNLAEHKFSVEHVAMVGTDLRLSRKKQRASRI
jgi:hypothetical protein